MSSNTPSWLSWFLTTIVLAIIINIVSNYLKDRIDLVWGKYSDKRKTKNKLLMEKMENQVSEMLADPEQVGYYYYNVILYAVKACFYLIFFAVFVGIVFSSESNTVEKIIFSFLSILSMIMCLYLYTKSSGFSGPVREYHRRRKHI